MQSSNSQHTQEETRTPWPPIVVSLVCFLLPAGGAVLTILNLQRLRQIDRSLARQLIIALLLVFALGITALIAISPHGKGGLPNPDTTTSATIDIGVAFASFLAQRTAFRNWKAANPRGETASWTGALGLGLIYTIGAILAALPFYGLAAGILYAMGRSVHG